MIAHPTLRLAAPAGAGAAIDRAGKVSDADVASFHTARPRLFRRLSGARKRDRRG